jgi:S-(hydroxymethyl)glutathione dehydrogenase / alcohol dehydrogenase
MVRAVVLGAIGEPMRVEEIELPQPGPGMVRVRLAAAGVCHSDLSLANGVLRQPVPAVLGHEGAGTVVSVGDGVTGVAPGDGVVLNWSPSCGSCHFCALGEPYLCLHSGDATSVPYATFQGAPLYAGLGTAAFAEETIVPAGGVLPLPDGVPLTDAALLGCAVLTGFGAVTHAASVRPGESVVVYGLGGVGLATIQAARIAGATTIIAVDIRADKEELALAQGATHFLVADDAIAKTIRGLTGGFGADHAFECVGRAATIRTAWSSTRRGGNTTVVGIGGAQDKLEFSALELFHFARTLRGCVYGNGDAATDLPILAGHVQAGRLDLGALISDRITLEGVPDALDRMARGAGARSLVLF